MTQSMFKWRQSWEVMTCSDRGGYRLILMSLLIFPVIMKEKLLNHASRHPFCTKHCLEVFTIYFSLFPNIWALNASGEMCATVLILKLKLAHTYSTVWNAVRGPTEEFNPNFWGGGGGSKQFQLIPFITVTLWTGSIVTRSRAHHSGAVSREALI